MKKLNLVTACLVAIAFALLLALTIRRLASGGAEETPAASPPPSAAASPSATPPSAAPDGGVAETTPDEPATPPPTPVDGERFTVEAPYARERLSITIDTGNYTREAMEDGDLYYAAADESRSVFIEILFVNGSVDARKPSFLDAYLPDYTNMDELGEVLVASSPVVGEGVTVTDGSSIFDAWLIEVENGFFAVVAGYKTQEQGGELYRMLDTLAFEK